MTKDKFREMNNYIKVLGLLSVSALGLCNCMSAEESAGNSPLGQKIVCAVNPHQINIAPKKPANIEFCGEKLELKNYYMKERFDRELISMSYYHSNVFLMIKRANRYFPILEKILREEGVPDDFKYLACIESSLDQRAVSPTGAAGMWQIMPEVGKELGLVVASDVDERYNIEKATRAACAHLKATYAYTKNWTLAAAAYNTGRARVLRQIEAQQTNNFFDMQFSEETNRYVYRILLAKYVLEDPSRIGFYMSREDLYYPVETTPVVVDTAIPNLTDFAKQYGITLQLLKDSNAWLRDNKLVKRQGKSFTIAVPNKEKLNLTAEEIPVYNEKWIQCVPE
ncbi:MAG: lytic transglycosylase domain-containing protein [Paludibacteraceae bacterium]|nr:lytic transglycosylase domain-containing protein [Paludibacteraceae bacterium]